MATKAIASTLGAIGSDLRAMNARDEQKEKRMMTELEAVAESTAVALKNADGWAKAEADRATAHLKALLKKGEIDTDTFAAATERVAGNHSARKQRLVAWGFITTPESDSAEKRAIAAAMERIDKAEDAALADIVAPKDATVKPKTP